MPVYSFARMILTALILTFLLNVSGTRGFDLNALRIRHNCYPNAQKNCHEDFIDAYPNLSRSSTNGSIANTFFFLFTRKNPDDPEKLHKCAGKLPPKSNFNPENDLFVITIPFITAYCDVAVYREWTRQLLERGDYNVLAVDWGWGNGLDYKTAVLNLKIVAKQTVIVLQNIQAETGIKKAKITLIGHSLGAQACGLIGYAFPVRRIIALDPAGPSYSKETALEDRLDSSDAELVEVWHTNAGRCLPNLGIDYDPGHVNFYINGGSIQLSCYQHVLLSLLNGDYIYSLNSLVSQPTCYHAQSTQYFRASINPRNCQFVGVQCKSYQDFSSGKCRSCGRNGNKCLIMGFDTDKYIRPNMEFPKIYYLDTSLFCPYCDNSKIRLRGYRSTYDSSLQSTNRKS